MVVVGRGSLHLRAGQLGRRLLLVFVELGGVLLLLLLLFAHQSCGAIELIVGDWASVGHLGALGVVVVLEVGVEERGWLRSNHRLAIQLILPSEGCLAFQGLLLASDSELWHGGSCGYALLTARGGFLVGHVDGRVARGDRRPLMLLD